MQPTFYAESLKSYAKAACIGMSEAERQIEALRKGTEGAITVAGPPLIMTELLPPDWSACPRNARSSRSVSFPKTGNCSRSSLTASSALVIAMLYNEMPKRGLVKNWLFDDRLVLVMRPIIRLRSDVRSRLAI